MIELSSTPRRGYTKAVASRTETSFRHGETGRLPLFVLFCPGARSAVLARSSLMCSHLSPKRPLLLCILFQYSSPDCILLGYHFFDLGACEPARLLTFGKSSQSRGLVQKLIYGELSGCSGKRVDHTWGAITRRDEQINGILFKRLPCHWRAAPRPDIGG
jgi:hypothetical protein